MRPNPWNLAVAGIAASWGFVSVMVAGVDLPGEALAFWRCLLAALTLPALLAFLGRLPVLALSRRRLQLLAYLEPLSAAVLAWAILGESVGWQVAVGGLAVLLGGALVVVYESGEPAVPEAPLAASAPE